MPSGSLIAMPTTPAAPASFEFLKPEIAAANTSIFTGQQQVQDWGAGPREVSFAMPAMTKATAAAWLTFVSDLKGMVNYFVFGTSFTTAYTELAGINWRLKTNGVKVSVGSDRMYRMSFDCREAT